MKAPTTIRTPSAFEAAEVSQAFHEVRVAMLRFPERPWAHVALELAAEARRRAEVLEHVATILAPLGAPS